MELSQEEQKYSQSEVSPINPSKLWYHLNFYHSKLILTFLTSILVNKLNGASL